MTTSDRQVYERALTFGHHPQRLHSELTLASLMPLAATGGGYKYRMPVLSAAIATEQLRTLPVRMKAAEANLATLREVLTSFDAPVTWPCVDDTSVRGWYGTPLIVTEHVHDPLALRGHLKAGAVPVRALYEDWAQTPLLQQPGLAARYWPHLAHPGLARELLPRSPPDARPQDPPRAGPRLHGTGRHHRGCCPAPHPVQFLTQ